MTVLEGLKQARDLLAAPGRWCQGRLAETVGGDACTPDDAGACRWCMVGALWRVSGGDVRYRNRLFRAAARGLPIPAPFGDAIALGRANDTIVVPIELDSRTAPREVMSVLDAAIEQEARQ